MKNCLSCNELTNDEALFCSKCGSPFSQPVYSNEHTTPPISNIPSYIPPPTFPINPPQYQQPQYIPPANQTITYQTRIVFYNSEDLMQRGIASWQNGGWEVVSTEVVQQGYSASKTCCLGAIFLPLALAGKKENHHKVTYRKPM